MRATWKGLFISPLIYSQVLGVDKQSVGGSVNNINSTSRSTRIVSEFVGLEFFIYNGKTFISLKVSNSMVGLSFRGFYIYKKNRFSYPCLYQNH